MKTNLYFIFTFVTLVRFSEANLYLSNKNLSAIIKFDEENCEVLTESAKLENLIENDSEKVTIIDDEEFAEIHGTCMLSSRFGNERYGFIYPGTLWCGRGTKATSDEQLGKHSKEDTCCREHDKCPSSLAAGECRAGVCNTSRFTRSHCECDNKFQECLRNSGTETGNTIGAIFFNVAQIFCFQETSNCAENSWLVVDNGRRTLGCPFQFLTSPKYIFSKPHFTFKNSKAFFLNFFLRKLNLGK